MFMFYRSDVFQELGYTNQTHMSVINKLGNAWIYNENLASKQIGILVSADLLSMGKAM